MKNYKINIDKPKPTQEEILAGRNFDAVLEQYKAAPGKVIKKPFWKTTGFIGSVAAVAATVAIVAMVLNGEDGNDITAPQNPGVVQNNDNVRQPDNNNGDGVVAPQWTPTKRTITPPLAGVNVPYQQYKVNSKRGGTIAYPTGTKITFKPDCFVDKSGNPVTGNVEVQYREMHDAVDFFLAGIPMQYDSAGQTYQLESAGMLEVAAFVNGEVVYLKKDKPMEVQMASSAGGTDFNLYYFDTVAGNWVYQGKDKVAPMPYDKEQRRKDSIAARELWLAQQAPVGGFEQHVPSKPVDAIKPAKANPAKNRFVVDFNKEEFPEMGSFENVIFEVDESKEKFDQSNYDVTWETVALSRGDEASTYKLTLRKGLKTLKLDVYPVLDGADFETAMANYEKAHAKYLADSATYANWRPANYHGNMNNSQPQFVFDPEAYKRIKYNAASSQVTYDVQRTFSLSGFGVYNMDSPEMLPQGSIVDLTINGPDNQIFDGYSAIYHVDRQRNTLMNYHNMNPVAGFHVNTKSANLMWAVKDGEMYYAENESFATMPLSGKVTVTLKQVGKKLNTAGEIRAFFHLKAPDAK